MVHLIQDGELRSTVRQQYGSYKLANPQVLAVPGQGLGLRLWAACTDDDDCESGSVIDTEHHTMMMCKALQKESSCLRAQNVNSGLTGTQPERRILHPELVLAPHCKCMHLKESALCTACKSKRPLTIIADWFAQSRNSL